MKIAMICCFKDQLLTLNDSFFNYRLIYLFLKFSRMFFRKKTMNLQIFVLFHIVRVIAFYSALIFGQ